MASGFLFFFGVVIATTVGICFAYLRARDGTRSLTPLSTPDTVDPYEIAYMRGGGNELTRVVIVSLVEQGYLEVQADVQDKTTLVPRSPWPVRFPNGDPPFSDDNLEKRISQTQTHPSARALSPMEQTVYRWFTEARTVKDVFEGSLPNELAGYSLPLEEKLQQEHLLSTDEDSHVRWTGGLVGGLVIGGAGGLRLLVGLSRDEPVGFLVLMSIAGIGWLAVVCSARRLSTLGRAYLEALQDAAAQLIASNGTQYALAAAALGMAGLENTPPRRAARRVREPGEDSGRSGDPVPRLTARGHRPDHLLRARRGRESLSPKHRSDPQLRMGSQRDGTAVQHTLPKRPPPPQ